MNKHLCIDCGNTLVKAALYDSDNIVAREQVSYNDVVALTRFVEGCNVTSALLSSTSMRSVEVVAAISPFLSCELKELSHETPLPLRLGYHTPATLGRDRIAAAVGAWEMFPGCNLLVIDAGTCVTLDVVTADGSFLGGNIAPGVEMRLRAMHEFTSKLPQVPLDGDVPMVGYDTDTAMRSGAVIGVANEIDAMSMKLRAVLGQLKVLLTGGSSPLFSEYLGEEACLMVPDLVLNGLNAIINYNEY